MVGLWFEEGSSGPHNFFVCKICRSVRQECCLGGRNFSEFFVNLPRGFYAMPATEIDSIRMFKTVGIEL